MNLNLWWPVILTIKLQNCSFQWNLYIEYRSFTLLEIVIQLLSRAKPTTAESKLLSLPSSDKSQLSIPVAWLSLLHSPCYKYPVDQRAHILRNLDGKVSKNVATELIFDSLCLAPFPHGWTFFGQNLTVLTVFNDKTYRQHKLFKG